jgi:uncharacterized protein YjbI with pentapeptide repeats
MNTQSDIPTNQADKPLTREDIKKLLKDVVGGARLDLRKQNLRGSDLSQLGLARVDLREADLSDANLSHANLSRALLRKADLSDANLSHANLNGANLSEANLSRADLSHANLNGATLSRTLLKGADLSQTTLIRAYLGDADLSVTSMAGADLTSAQLDRADFTGADLTGAIIAGTDLSAVDLSKATPSSELLTIREEYLKNREKTESEAQLKFQSAIGGGRHMENTGPPPIVGVFRDQTMAEHAVEKLKEAGFTNDQIRSKVVGLKTASGEQTPENTRTVLIVKAEGKDKQAFGILFSNGANNADLPPGMTLSGTILASEGETVDLSIPDLSILWRSFVSIIRCTSQSAFLQWKSLQQLAKLFPLLMKAKTVLALRQIISKFCGSWASYIMMCCEKLLSERRKVFRQTTDPLTVCKNLWSTQWQSGKRDN